MMTTIVAIDLLTATPSHNGLPVASSYSESYGPRNLMVVRRNHLTSMSAVPSVTAAMRAATACVLTTTAAARMTTSKLSA